MAKYRGKASITLVDVSDAKQLTALIVSDKPKQTIYNPNTGTYMPNFSLTPATLTPELYISGNINNIANEVKATRWYYQENSSGTKIEITGNTDTYELSTTQPRTLKIKRNIFETLNAMTFTVQMDYLDGDTSTGIVVTSQAMIDMLKVSNGINGDSTILSKLTAPFGTIIKNGEGIVTLVADMVKGMEKVIPESLRWYRAKDGAKDPDAGEGWEVLGQSGVRNLFQLNKVTGTKTDRGSILGGWANTIMTNENVLTILKPNTTYRISYKFKLNSLTPNSMAYASQGTHGSLYLYSRTSSYERILLSTVSSEDNILDAQDWKVGTIRERVCTFTTPANLRDSEGAYVILAYTRRSMVGEVATIETGEFYDIMLEEDNGQYHKWVPTAEDSGIVIGNENLLKTTTNTSTIVGMNKSNQTDARTNYLLATTSFNTLWVGMKKGDTFTFSCDVTISGTGFAGQFRPQTLRDPYIAMDSSYQITKAETARVSFTGTVTQALIDSSTVTAIQLRYDNIPTTVSLTISKPKLERGIPSGIPPYFPNITEMSPQKIVIQDDSIIVPANEVDGVLPIRAMMSYEDITSTATETIADISDPIQPVIIGNQYFRNGQGQNTYTYRLYRSGVEYDPDGTLGSYTWSLWDKKGQQISGFKKTGKSITISSDDFNERAEIDCEYIEY